MIRRVVFLMMICWVGIVNACEMPDFHKCFRLLAENRSTYNLYNDSIFLIKDHDQWVNFFRRRALKNHQLFAANKVIISEVLDYFKQDRKQIPQEAYSSLLHGLRRLFDEDKMDPFLGNEFADILMDYYDSGYCPDSLNFKALVDCYKGAFYWEMYTQGQDTTFMHKSYYYFKRPLEEDRYKSPSYIETSLIALNSMTVTNWLARKKQTIEEYMGYIAEMKALLKLPDRPTRIISEKDYKTIENLLKNTEERLVRNVYLADTTVMEKHTADSLMRILVARNLSDPNLSDLSYSRTLLMQMKLGQLTAKQAVVKMDSIYRRMRMRFYQKRFSPSQLREVLMPFTNYFYINDEADISFAQKRKRVKRLAHDIVEIYHRRIDQQGNNNYVKYLNFYASYPRAIKYLTERERIHYLNELNVATQVTTYAHSKHVSMIAETLMKGILKYQPELLVGALGDGDASQVRKHRKKYIEFIQTAGMYHDLGKNSIVTVVNNDYRPLTDKEYAIIKTHPQLGVEKLEVAPSLYKQYHDTTLGHHKWYNGKGGYPDSFDNTKSPVRIMIDIVTLSDCMQAATERVGRNYKGEKTFDTVMGEFRRDAGVRYNPDLVQLIDAHPDLASQLAELINDGWVEIYYDIYSKFIK